MLFDIANLTLTIVLCVVVLLMRQRLTELTGIVSRLRTVNNHLAGTVTELSERQPYGN